MTTHSAPDLFDTGPASQRQRSRQAELGQFFTPSPIANFMASIFPEPGPLVRLLDAGAGEGALTDAFITRWREGREIDADAYEIDDALIPTLTAKLSSISSEKVIAARAGGDFLETAATMICLGRGLRYTHAILNPPYRKIATASRERRFAAAVGLETVNLYSAFVGLALDLLEPGGQLVAIIPRSFCNGPYYRPFRQWLFARAALRRIHLFDSRRDAFSGDAVLQENVILHLERGGSPNDVVVSTSTGAGFHDLSMRSIPFGVIVADSDTDYVINIPTGNSEALTLGFGNTLADLGLDVATGPVVDFRLRDHLRKELGDGDAPLLYPQHLKGGRIVWPLAGKKANAIAQNSTTRRWLLPNGWYVLVKRFSSKEEKRRVVATLCDPASLPGDLIGVDNKVNVLHSYKRPISEKLARGLTIYLNSTDVDRAFRLFSGHTQVNASDLRRLKFPDFDQLEAIGASHRELSSQADIDICVGQLGTAARLPGGSSEY